MSLDQIRLSVGVDSAPLDRDIEELRLTIETLPPRLVEPFHALSMALLQCRTILAEEVEPAGRETLRLQLSLGWAAEFSALAEKVSQLDAKRRSEFGVAPE